MVDQVTKRLVAELAIRGLDDLDDFNARVAKMKAAIIEFVETANVSLSQAKIQLSRLLDEQEVAAFRVAFDQVKQEMVEVNKSLDMIPKDRKIFATPTEETIRLRIETEKAREAIINIANQTGSSYKQAAAGLQRSGIIKDTKALNMALSEANMQAKKVAGGFTGMFAPLNNVSKEMYQGMEAAKGFTGMFAPLASGADKASGAFGRFGKIISGVFIGMIAFRIFKIVTDFIAKLKEMTEASLEFVKEQERFIVTVRALQRSGLDTTLEEWKELVDILGERFTQFSERDLASGIEQILKLGRQVGLSSEEMKEWAANIAVLATITGKTFDDAADAFTDAAKSGRTTDTLREMAGAMTETTVAAEAVALGLAKSTDEVDEYTRTVTLMILAEREALASGEDLSFIQNSVAGQITETKKNIEELGAEIGERFLPIWLNMLRGFEDFLEVIDDALERLEKFIDGWETLSNALLKIRTAQSLGISSEDLMTGKVSVEEFEAEMEKVRKMDEALGDAPIGNVSKKVAEGLEEGNEDVKDIISKYLEDINDAWQDYRDKQIDIQTDFQRDLEEISRKGADKRRELALDLANDLVSISRKEQDKFVDAAIDYQQKLGDLQQEIADERAEIEEKYRNDE